MEREMLLRRRRPKKEARTDSSRHLTGYMSCQWSPRRIRRLVFDPAGLLRSDQFGDDDSTKHDQPCQGDTEQTEEILNDGFFIEYLS